MIAARLRLAALAVPVAVLAACTSSTGGSGSAQVSAGSAPRSSATGSSASAPSSGGSTSAGSTSRTAAGSSSAAASSISRNGPGRPVPARPLRTVTAQGVHATYVIKIWAEVRTSTCADHAYGNPVIAYLRKHPCRGLTRQLGTTVVNGRAVGFARSVLGFAGTAPGVYSVAGDFETLVSKNGTGNLSDLFRSGYRLPGGPARVPSPDAFNVQAQDAGVVVLDAWYLSGPTPENDPPLTQLGEETFGQF